MSQQQPVELILMRQLASTLSMPSFIAGNDEKLLYYNDAAGALLGQGFDEADGMSLDELSDLFNVTATDGRQLGSDELPLGVALRERRPCHLQLRVRALDGAERDIEVTALPLRGHANRFAGAVAFFWEAQQT